MWLITPIGFFSIVRKPGDAAHNTLTVRARVRADLESLRALHLPELGEISESSHNDYRFRAQAPRPAVEQAMVKLVQTLTYGNFKSAVAKVQGYGRAGLYHEVWDVLHQLQTQPAKFAGQPAVPLKVAPAGPVLHPRPDEHGQPLVLKHPSQATPLATWGDPAARACVLPDGPLPPTLNGLALAAWAAPQHTAGWEALAQAHAIAEPPFQPPAGYKRAAGVVVREPDGRFWVVAPSNQFAGYSATFPKGRVEAGRSLQATALVEAFEESGLQVRLRAHLIDLKRSQSYTRYYLAERVGGLPADMGWETQAVMLVPQAQLPQVLTHPNDQPLLAALAQHWPLPQA
ncbi:NUDIX hydrolase [Ideonella livida]|uniref:NUDIX hydrolase n=1 Tax=Ideonella livida TaxID=2707176 RepID=A0A7C9TLI6_9BURK|nr:NUDIX hydrolase [Ideonella livida]NDY93198.1 NUDIX hydrolase [Ideonella livida]